MCIMKLLYYGFSQFPSKDKVFGPHHFFLGGDATESEYLLQHERTKLARVPSPFL